MNNLTPMDSKIPAHLAKYVGSQSALAASIAGGLGSNMNYPRISIKGSRFRIVEDGNETVLNVVTLDAVIVGANPRLSKAWYARAWDNDAEPSAPDCYSLDGVGPDPQSTDPQNDLCASCPQNAWGSKITPSGQQVKACADKKRLAIVAAEDPDGAVYLLEVTPAALKGLNQYQRELSMRGIPPEIVITKIGFDTDASFPKLKFGFGGFIDEPTQAIVSELLGSDQVKGITGEPVDTPEQPVAAPAAAAKPKTMPQTKAKPAPVVVEVVEPEPELVVEPDPPKRGFGAGAKAKPAPKAAEKPATKTGFGGGAKAKPKVEEASDEDPALAEGDLAATIAALVQQVSDDG